MISAITNHLPTPTQMVHNVANNLRTISSMALPLIAIAAVPTTQAGIVSYTACIATCKSMAAMAAPGLFAYTFAACKASCTWMMSPTCP